MAQNKRPVPRPSSATTAGTPGTGSWSRARLIYLAAGILACAAGVLMIAFSL